MQQRTHDILRYAFLGALITWGLYTLFYYIGVPLHAGVLLTDAAQKSVTDACGGSNFFCQGLFGFVPFVEYTLSRFAPFVVYIVLSVVLYGAFVAWTYVKTAHGILRLRLKTWYFVVAFLASLWVIFLVLSHGPNGELPMRRLVQPGPNVYQNITEQTLQSLTDNFDELQKAGCLDPAGTVANNVPVFDVSELCIQQSFVSRVLFQFVVAVLFLFELLIAGHMILTLCRFRPHGVLLDAMMSTGVGVLVWIAVLWAIAVAGVYVSQVGWALVILVPVLCYRSVIHWLKTFLRHEWQVELPWYAAQNFLAWLLISYLALNFLTVIRPFPIGWDDLGSYLNRPRLLVSYGHFIPTMATFQWEYLTSLGFLLLGYANPVGATASMIINWTEGLLAVLGVYLLSRQYLGKNRGLLAALLYYTLPLVGHFSFADMKIDNAVFLMGTLATLALFKFLFPTADERTDTADESHRGDRRWLVLSGLFIALGFGMKVTSSMVLLALLALLTGGLFEWYGLAGGCILVLCVLAKQGILRIPVIAERAFGSGVTVTSNMFLAVMFPLGLVPLLWGVFRLRNKAKGAVIALGIFLGSFVIGIAPWLFYNNYLAGNVIPRLETGAPNTLTPRLVFSGNDRSSLPGQDVRLLPPELQLDKSNTACMPTGAVEELDRYWGFGKGIGHYLLLPWRTVMNIDSGGYYVTTAPYLLLFPLLLLVPLFWPRRNRWMRYFFVATLLILAEWMFLANGVPWYGIGVFLGLAVGVEALVAYAPGVESRAVLGFFLTMSLLTSLAFRMWQFEQQRNLIEYPMGKISAASLEQRTIPWYGPITNVVVSRHEAMPDRPYMYRVGTFIAYFIPKNLEMIGVTDHQLDTFNCLNQEHNHALTLKRLKALGFNSIIFDTNTATIEKDEHGSLHQKVQHFVDFLNDSSLGLQVLVNDPGTGVAFITLP